MPDHTKLVYVSSDHVFGGDGVYTEESSWCPISVYGRTRVEAERLVLKRANSLVIRPGLGIGVSPNGRTGHLDWLRHRTLHNLPITIIEDEYRSVVWLRELAERVLTLAQSTETGIRHILRDPSRFQGRAGELSVEPVGNSGLRLKSKADINKPTPHLGRVELTSLYRGELFSPLVSVLDRLRSL